jgi:hypothetical protein
MKDTKKQPDRWLGTGARERVGEQQPVFSCRKGLGNVLETIGVHRSRNQLFGAVHTDRGSKPRGLPPTPSLVPGDANIFRSSER